MALSENRALPTPMDVWVSPILRQSLKLCFSGADGFGTSPRAKALPSSAPIPGALGAAMGGGSKMTLIGQPHWGR